MSFARLALRLAACEALCPEATVETGPYPTIAANRVYDSRIDLIQSDEQLAAIESKPLIVVYTEEDEAQPYGSGKRIPDEQVVVLVVEAMIAARGTLEVEQPDGTLVTVGTIEAPITDRQHEALLDTLEATVRRLFDRRALAPSAALYAKVAIETRSILSLPQRAADRVTRLAARTIKFHVKVHPDTWPAVPVVPAPTGFDVLPEPLRTVALGLAPSSTAFSLCQRVAGLVPAPVAPTPLTSIVVTTDLDLDPADAFPTEVVSHVDFTPQDLVP